MKTKNKKEPIRFCSRCKKNKATITYANSVMDFAHGFSERICQTCYDNQKKANGWYKAGRVEAIDEEIKFLDSLLQDKTQKKLSDARRQDTKRNTIPDLYDIKIKKRIKTLKTYK